MIEIEGVQMFTTPEASEIMGITKDAVRNLITRGKLKATKQGRDNYVTQEAIDQYQATKAKTGWKAGVPRKANK